jgi:1-acyl-sn-glycerol-3-phosphate acyltransferase
MEVTKETVNSFQKRFDALTKETCNHEKIVLFAEADLLKMDLEDSTSEVSNTEMSPMIETLKRITESIKLGYAQRPKMNIFFTLVDKVDQFARLLSVWCFLATSGILLSIPCIFFKNLDYVLVKLGLMPNHYQISTFFKAFINRGILVLSGVHLVVEGLNPEYFKNDVALACFSHASTMDAFILSGTLPVQQITMVKSDLFLVPFFSWLMFAFGCVPIDRSNREQAVKALGDSVSAAKMGEAIAISPEGSRSKTGLLMSFKKGPFYLWEQLQSPIIPMVITGAFDLYPPGNQMNVAGKVYCKYLKPIQPSEATTRDGISRVLRRRMLEALRDGPSDSAAPLTWMQRGKTWSAFLALTAFYLVLWKASPYAAFKRVCLEPKGITTNSFLLLCLLLVVVITLLLYVYVLYVPRLMRYLSPPKAKKI